MDAYGRETDECLPSPAIRDFGGSRRAAFARLWMKLMCLLLAVAAIGSAAAPAVASDEQDCFQGQESELRIKGCSGIIQRTPDDATAYHHRAVAYGLTGDINNAIADYTKVIQIAPDNASAYDNRGRAYARKGDYTHAVEDGTKAQKLMAKALAQPVMATPKAPKKSKVPANARKTTKPAPKATANATALPTMVTLIKAPKNSKVTANARKTTKPAPKATVTPKANNNLPKATPRSSWWSWLTPWSNSADQAGSKNAKP
jgi:tetratricopeptide (TPR) repeat protein